MVANYLHTYSYGVKISTRLIRNYGEYKFVGKNSYYNSDYQYLLYHSDGILIQPGDQMITTCTYDTSDEADYVFVSVMISFLFIHSYIYLNNL